MKKGSMVKPIPPKMRAEMAEDPWYRKCCVRWSLLEECSGEIQWHHNFHYQGKRVNEKFCILPVCKFHHEHEARKEVKEILNTTMALRSTAEEREKYNKFQWSRYL